MKYYKVLRNEVEGPDQMIFRTREEAERHMLWWRGYTNKGDRLTIKEYEVITGKPE